MIFSNFLGRAHGKISMKSARKRQLGFKVCIKKENDDKYDIFQRKVKEKTPRGRKRNILID